MDNFNQVGTGADVMLLLLTAGGLGLVSIGGTNVLNLFLLTFIFRIRLVVTICLCMIDLHWDPALEQQASDGIYRLGQTKNVFVHR